MNKIDTTLLNKCICALVGKNKQVQAMSEECPIHGAELVKNRERDKEKKSVERVTTIAEASGMLKAFASHFKLDGYAQSAISAEEMSNKLENIYKDLIDERYKA